MIHWSADKADTYFSPWVMRSAWNKALHWYSLGEWADPAELLAWRAEPWRHLADLASELAAGTYKPFAFPEIPYPKKGGYTRHYVMPSVRDQVAFMVFLVLLGPFLEARMPNVSFGNRLYRPRVLRHPRNTAQTDGRKTWYQAPFSLSTSRIYSGFSTSYGLFRRVLQWLVNECVLGRGEDSSTQSDLSTEDPDLLPYLRKVKGCFRGTELVYARLDMRMTYPSLDRQKLADTAKSLLLNEVSGDTHDSPVNRLTYSEMGRPSFPSLDSKSEGFSNWIEPFRTCGPEHPWRVLAGAGSQIDRVKLARQMCDALMNVVYAPWETPQKWTSNVNNLEPCSGCGTFRKCAKKGDAERCWVGPHGYSAITAYTSPDEPIVQPDGGLPTGLAISGLLLNAAMTPVDEAMVTLWRKEWANDRLFMYLRFVDDVVMLASTPDVLEKGIREFIDSVPSSLGEGVRVNLAKAEPIGIRDFLQEIEGDHGYPGCSGRRNGEGDPAETSQGDSVRLVSFLKPQDYLTRSNLELFSTTVVREMSDLGEESLDEKYGAAGVERLERLMELATLEIEDFEVGADARLSFAVNKIASAAWPDGDVVCDDRVVTREEFAGRIMLIAETALRRHPWRYKLWRPILAIAVRASTKDAVDRGRQRSEEAEGGTQPKQLGSTGLRGLDWLLTSVLPLIAWAQDREASWSQVSWECHDAEAYLGTEGHPCKRPKRLRTAVEQRLRERCSFHRAEFFRQLAGCLTTLQRVADIESESPVYGWASHISQQEAQALLKEFSNLSHFLNVLYGGWKWRWPGKPFLWWWELEAMALAVLRADNPSDNVVRLMQPPGPLSLRTRNGIGHQLVVDALYRYKMIPSRRHRPFLVMGCKSSPVQRRALVQAPRGAWLYLLCQSRSTQDRARSLFPELHERSWAAMARLSLWAFHHQNVVGGATLTYECPRTELPDSWSELWRSYIVLMDYSSLRRFLLAHGVGFSFGAFASWFPDVSIQSTSAISITKLNRNLQRAMYSLLPSDTQVYPNPSSVPAVGLSYLVAQQILSETKDAISSPGRSITVCPSTVVLGPSAYRDMLRIRQSLFVSGNQREFVKPKLSGKKIIMGVDQLSSEHPAPHPIYLLSKDLCGGSQDVANSYRLAALMLWMLEGGESLLDTVMSMFPWHIPFTERHDIRARYTVPERIWSEIEKELGVSHSWRIDTPTDGEARDDYWVTHITMDTSGGWTVDASPRDPDPDQTVKELHVRVVQPIEHVLFENWKASKDRPIFVEDKDSMGGVPAEVAVRLHESWSDSRIACFGGELLEGAVSEHRVHQSKDIPGRRPRDHIVVFSECYCDSATARGFRQFCRETGIGVLCGMLPRELPRAVPVVPPVRHKGLRCLVNEAILVLPGYETPREGASLSLPTQVHQFFIRKCMPSVSEIALSEHLEKTLEETTWRFVGGDRWVRVSHPTWGAFCITICSDVLTTGKWRELSCRVQHLFIPAMNTDVNLYDQLTWVRGYELFANAITVNHGIYGGTAVWTPRRGYDREVFHVRGRNKGVSAVVAVPVRDLIEAQREQYSWSLDEWVEHWEGMDKSKGKPKTADDQESVEKERRRRFKTPPPTTDHVEP
jgi:hypothetical protein